MCKSEESYARALALALRLLQETSGREQAIVGAFDRVYSRRPQADEIKIGLAHWRASERKQSSINIVPKIPPVEVVQTAKEENTGEAFQYTEHLEAYEDYIPDLRPSDVDVKTRALADVCLVLFNSNEFVYIY